MIILIKTQIRKKFLVPWEKLLRSSLGLKLMNMQPGGRKTLKKKSKAYLRPVFWNVKHLVTNGDHSWCSYVGTAADAVLEMSCAHWNSDKVPIDFSDRGRRLFEGDCGLCGKAAELWMTNCFWIIRGSATYVQIRGKPLKLGHGLYFPKCL